MAPHPVRFATTSLEAWICFYFTRRPSLKTKGGGNRGLDRMMSTDPVLLFVGVAGIPRPVIQASLTPAFATTPGLSRPEAPFIRSRKGLPEYYCLASFVTPGLRPDVTHLPILGHPTGALELLQLSRVLSRRAIELWSSRRHWSAVARHSDARPPPGRRRLLTGFSDTSLSLRRSNQVIARIVHKANRCCRWTNIYASRSST